jgi:hypothetical protein
MWGTRHLWLFMHRCIFFNGLISFYSEIFAKLV